MEVVLFSSKRCNVCSALKPKVEELAKRFGLKMNEVVIEEEPAKAAQLMVFSAPTLLILEKGREVKRWSGVFSISDVEEFIQRVI